MNSKYLCSMHVERILIFEPEAFRSWSHMMQRGVNAYVKCRTDAAHSFLNAAFDIALLRLGCDVNSIFMEFHVTKPAELLIQLYLLDEAFDQAATLLRRIQLISDSNGQYLGADVVDFMARQYRCIEVAEKEFYGQAQAQVQTEVKAGVNGGRTLWPKPSSTSIEVA